MAIEYSNQYMLGSVLPVDPETSDVTMACWFNAANVTGGFALISLANGALTSPFIGLEARGDVAGDPVRMRQTNALSAHTYAVTSTGFSASTWHHALGTWNVSNGEMVAYIDGGSSGSATGTTTDMGGFSRYGFGGHVDSSPSNFFSGYMAEAAIWNTVLGAGDIAALASGFAPTLVRASNLVSYVPQYVSDRNDDYVTGDPLEAPGGLVGSQPHPRIFSPHEALIRTGDAPAVAGGGLVSGRMLMGVG